ncbi:MAG TPA: tetratricopeptide repeat protein, partial [Bryobacteraceae bacterium]|nr:tetratricopeptide repeat protein [Bryobacteraceae bacterium]
ILSASLHAQTQPQWAPRYKAALTQIQTGQVDAGIRELEALGAAYPKDAELLTSIGAAFDIGSRHRQADVWYAKALAIDPACEPALNNLALSLASQGRLAEARPLLEKVTRMDPRNGKAAYNLAVIALRLNHFEEAAREFEAARHASQPPAPAQTLALGEATALFKLGRYTQARDLLRCLDQASCLLLGSSQALAGDLPLAVRSFQRAVDLAPQSPDPYFRLALAFLQGRREADAQATLDTGLRMLPHSPLLLYGQALLFAHQGDYGRAEASAQEAVERRPAWGDAWAVLAELRAHRGEAKAADDAFRRALQLDGSAEHAAAYGEFLLRAGRLPAALEVLQAGRRAHPGSASLDRALGKLYQSQGRLDRAQALLRRAVREDPQDASAHYALAMTLQRLHRDAEAQHELVQFAAARQKQDFVRVLQQAGP